MASRGQSQDIFSCCFPQKSCKTPRTGNRSTCANLDISGVLTVPPDCNMWRQRVNRGMVLTKRAWKAPKCREVGASITTGSKWDCHREPQEGSRIGGITGNGDRGSQQREVPSSLAPGGRQMEVKVDLLNGGPQTLFSSCFWIKAYRNWLGGSLKKTPQLATRLSPPVSGHHKGLPVSLWVPPS